MVVLGWSGSCDGLCSVYYLLLQDGYSALMLASAQRHAKCVKALLLGGADVNIQAKVSSPKAVRCHLLMCVLVVCVTRKSDK